jgi:hypothetical protein
MEHLPVEWGRRPFTPTPCPGEWGSGRGADSTVGALVGRHNRPASKDRGNNWGVPEMRVLGLQTLGAAETVPIV